MSKPLISAPVAKAIVKTAKECGAHSLKFDESGIFIKFNDDGEDQPEDAGFNFDHEEDDQSDAA